MENSQIRGGEQVSGLVVLIPLDGCTGCALVTSVSALCTHFQTPCYTRFVSMSDGFRGIKPFLAFKNVPISTQLKDIQGKGAYSP